MLPLFRRNLSVQPTIPPHTPGVPPPPLSARAPLLATVPGDELEYKDDSDGGPDSDEEYLKEMKSAAPSAAHDDGRAQHHGKHASAQSTKKSTAGFTVKVRSGDGDSDSDEEGKRETGGLDSAIRQLACSATDTLALTVDGQVFMWGTVSHGKGQP